VPFGAWAADDVDVSPFFGTFKTMCADTRADPDAVVKAVSGAGGLASAPVKVDNTIAKEWRISIGGRVMLVSSSAGKSPAGAHRERQIIDCEITSLNDERANLADFAKWAGVGSEPDTSSATSYAFQEREGAHLANTGNDSDEHWVLAIHPGERVTTVQLMHVMAVAP